MPLYVVTYVHPQEELWLEHLEPHLNWIHARLGDNTLLAWGPLEDVDEMSALLVLHAESSAHLDAIVALDPYVSEGVVTSMTVVAWLPMSISRAFATYVEGSAEL